MDKNTLIEDSETRLEQLVHHPANVGAESANLALILGAFDLLRRRRESLVLEASTPARHA
ncbi:MAG: hypothetical protein ABIR79_03085 [Candidatus Binatia bacterium]